MKVHLLLENLQKKISFINKGVSSKTQLPILSNILLEAVRGKLKIISTDLEIGIEVEIPANIEEEGGITVPAKPFSDLVNILSQDKITLITKKDSLEVNTSKTKNTFQTIAKDEFPKLYEEKGEKIIILKNEIIQKELTKIIFAASFDLGRPALSGILLKEEDKTGTNFLLVATDGYRLSLKSNINNFQKTKREELSKKIILIPARVLREVINLKEEAKDVEVFISQEKNQILFEQNGTLIVGRLIEAEFPAYEKIIPANCLTKFDFDKEEMQKAVKICAIFARDSANIIRFLIKKDKIIISANTPNIGENIVELEAKVEGEENEIAFNARYLLDLFANIEENEMIFEMTGPLSPGVFKIKDDPTFLHIIMPIRVQG